MTGLNVPACGNRHRFSRDSSKLSCGRNRGRIGVFRRNIHTTTARSTKHLWKDVDDTWIVKAFATSENARSSTIHRAYHYNNILDTKSTEEEVGKT